MRRFDECHWNCQESHRGRGEYVVSEERVKELTAELRRQKLVISTLTEVLTMVRDRATFNINWSDFQRNQIDNAIREGEDMSYGRRD
jgi:hypothetical protein